MGSVHDARLQYNRYVSSAQSLVGVRGEFCLKRRASKRSPMITSPACRCSFAWCMSATNEEREPCPCCVVAQPSTIAGLGKGLRMAYGNK
jgi:hypothetical protein